MSKFAMQDILSEKISELPEVEFPAGLHTQIMGQVITLRFRRTFIAVLSVLFLNLIIAGSFFFIRLIDKDAFTFINFMAREFEISGGYFLQFLSVIRENVPIGLTAILFLNIILIGYILKVYFSFKNVGRAFLAQNISYIK